MTNEELFEEWWSGKSADYQRMTAPIDIWLAACRISNEYTRKKSDPEDFIGACDPSLLSDSLPGQLEAKLAAADRLAEELDNMATQYGCVCGHPYCNHCKDTRDARRSLTAYNQAKGKTDE